MSEPLDVLATNDFVDSIGVVLPPSPQRHVLQGSTTVRKISTGLRYGQITEDDVRRFIAKLLIEFKSGEFFKHDMALAAIAVAMEHWDDPFAEEYLIDLARVERHEFRSSFRIARECLKARYAFPRTQLQVARYSINASTSHNLTYNVRSMLIPQHESQGRLQKIVHFEAYHAEC